MGPSSRKRRQIYGKRCCRHAGTGNFPPLVGHSSPHEPPDRGSTEAELSGDSRLTQTVSRQLAHCGCLMGHSRRAPMGCARLPGLGNPGFDALAQDRLSDSSGEISYVRQYNLVDGYWGVSHKTVGYCWRNHFDALRPWFLMQAALVFRLF